MRCFRKNLQQEAPNRRRSSGRRESAFCIKKQHVLESGKLRRAKDKENTSRDL
jgi:hypothetical protein